MEEGFIDTGTITEFNYLHTDHLGSVIAATDEAGSTVWRNDYTPFGEQAEKDESKYSLFTGKQYDSDIGLTYFNARWYDPNLGRFISEDPIRSGQNWYVYCKNNPLMYTDPTGLQSCSIVGTYVNGIQVSPYNSMQMGPYSTLPSNTAVGQYMAEHAMKTKSIEDALTSIPTIEITRYPLVSIFDMVFNGSKGHDAANEQLADMNAFAVSELNSIYSGENPTLSYDPDKGLTDSFVSEVSDYVNNQMNNTFDENYNFFGYSVSRPSYTKDDISAFFNYKTIEGYPMPAFMGLALLSKNSYQEEAKDKDKSIPFSAAINEANYNVPGPNESGGIGQGSSDSNHGLSGDQSAAIQSAITSIGDSF